MIREPLLNSIVNADSCTTETGLPNAPNNGRNFPRNNSAACRSDRERINTSAGGSNNAAFNPSAAAV